MLARLSAGLDAGGRIVTWRQDVWSNGFIGRPTSGGEPRLLALTHLAGGVPMSPAPDGPPAGWMGATRNAVPGYDVPARDGRYASRILAAGLVPVIEPEVSISSPHKEQAETLLRDAITKHVGGEPARDCLLSLHT